MKIIGNKKYPQPGDIIEYNGKKYYVKELHGYEPCCYNICTLKRQCTKVFKEFNCDGWHYFLPIKQAIKEEKKKLKESEQLIKKLESNL